MHLSKDRILSHLRQSKASLSNFGVKDIGLFGSFVRGQEHANSDIDLLIDFEINQDSYDNFMAAYDLIENLFPADRVEIVTRNGLSPYIGPQILKEVVYA